MSRIVAIVIGSLTVVVALVRPAGAAIAVTGAVACPTPAEVAARTAALVPPAAGERWQATLRDGGADLYVLLRDETGAVSNERRLPRGALACSELAAAAATVIATWLSDVHPEFVAPARPVRPARGDLAARAPPPPTGWSLHASLGLVGSLAPAGGDGGFGAGLAVAAGVAPAVGGFGVRLGLGVETERSFRVGGGRAHTRRSTLALGPSYVFTGGPMTTEIAASALAAWFTVRGTGFPRGFTTAEADFGAAGQVTFALARPIAPFVALSAVGWPRTRTAVDLASDLELALPRAELGAVVGLRATLP